MDEIDEMFATVLVSMSEDGKTEGQPKSFPDYPEENPSKAVLIRWLDQWEDDFNTSGYAAIMRGELPHDVARLTERELVEVPESTATDQASVSRRAAVESENARIEFTNKQNKAERIAKITELKNRVASKIKKAMRLTAPIKLQELLDTNALVDEDGNEVANAFDGPAMFKSILKLTQSKHLLGGFRRLKRAIGKQMI